MRIRGEQSNFILDPKWACSFHRDVVRETDSLCGTRGITFLLSWIVNGSRIGRVGENREWIKKYELVVTK